MDPVSPTEFSNLVAQEPEVEATLLKVFSKVDRNSYSAISEVIALSALLPVVVFLVREVGMPWLYEGKRYSELWRAKFHEWIDNQYEKEGFDPDLTEAAGAELIEKLENTNSSTTREAWERFAEKIK